jgi:hypothetical protein
MNMGCRQGRVDLRFAFENLRFSATLPSLGLVYKVQCAVDYGRKSFQARKRGRVCLWLDLDYGFKRIDI